MNQYIFNHRLSSAFLPTNLDKVEHEVVVSSLKLTQELRDRIKSQGKFDEDTFYGRAMSDMMNNMSNVYKHETQIMTDIKAGLFGATDTTSSQLLFVIFHLAKYPKYQRKIYNELCHVFGDTATIDNISFSVTNLVKLPTVKAFVLEVCRLYNVADHGQYRIARNTVNIKIDGRVQYSLPPGMFSIFYRFDIGFLTLHCEQTQTTNVTQVQFLHFRRLLLIYSINTGKSHGMILMKRQI